MVNILNKLTAFYNDPEVSLRAKIVLTVYATAGLPGLPFACFMWVINLYVLESKKQSMVDFLCWMIIFALFFSYPVGIYTYCNR